MTADLPDHYALWTEPIMADPEVVSAEQAREWTDLYGITPDDAESSPRLWLATEGLAATVVTLHAESEARLEALIDVRAKRDALHARLEAARAEGWEVGFSAGYNHCAALDGEGNQ